MIERARDEALSPEAGEHAHHQQQIDIAEIRFDLFERTIRVECETRARIARAYCAEVPADIGAGFNVDGKNVCSRLDEGRNVPVRILDHEVNVELHPGNFPQRFHHRRP